MFGSDDEVFAPRDRSWSPAQPQHTTGGRHSGGVRPPGMRENDVTRQRRNSKNNDSAPRRPRTSGRDLPPLHSIHKGSVVSVQSYGAFVRLGDGSQYKDGLLHVSKLSAQRVDAVEDVVSSGDTVWVKVVEVRTDEAKYSLDMRHVGQKDGEDHDPTNTQVTDVGGCRRTGPEPIRIGAVQATTCSRCGARGHAARECFADAGVQYELLEEPPDEGLPTRDKNASAKAREMEKELRRKLKKTPLSSSSSSSSSSSLSASAIKEYMKKRKAKKELKKIAGMAEDSTAKSKKKKKKKEQTKKKKTKKDKELNKKKVKKNQAGKRQEELNGRRRM